MPLTEHVIERAQQLAAGVVADWKPMAESLSWSLPPIDEDHLEDLIRELCVAALHRQSEGAASRTLIRAAAEHGRERRDDGFTDAMLLREYHLLRRGLWKELQASDPLEATETIMRLDAEITMATSASMFGFHLAPGEPVPDDLVERIAQQWS